MLAFSGHCQLAMQPLSLGNQVEEISTLVRASIPKGVRLNLNLPPDLPLIAADAGQIQRMVLNLAQDRAEAAGIEGVVTISTGTRALTDGELAGSLAGAPLPLGPYIVLEVKDTGPGMDAATQAKMFDPNSGVDLSERGLGLAAILGIVRAHRGGISVTSDPGNGATLQVFLPIAGASAAPPAVETGRSASG
jgi:signal transduction histidine kinase